MDDKASIIYLVAADANALTSKRLHGLGFCLAQAIEIVASITDLPDNPEKNAYLVIPDSLESYLTQRQAQNWSKVFIVTSNPNRKTATEGVIFVNSFSEPRIVWQKVLHSLLDAQTSNLTNHSWAARSVTGSCTLNNIAKTISTQNHFFAAKKHRSMQSLFQAIAALPKDVATTPVTFAVSVDANELKLNISLPDRNPNLLSHFIKIAMTSACDTQLQSHKQDLRFAIFAKLNELDSTFVCLVDVARSVSLQRSKSLEDAS